MPENSHISRIPETLRIAKEIARTREICRLSAQLLRTSTSDTFLGRKTHEPFAEELVADDISAA